jgi:thymidylate kinase
MLANEFLMQLFQAQAIDVKTMLENSSYPFAAKILEAIKNNEQQAMEQQQMAGVPQVPVENHLMQRAMDNGNASELDGIRMSA